MLSGHCWQNQNFEKLIFSAICAKVGQKPGVAADLKAEVLMHKMKIYERRVYFCKLTEEEKLTAKQYT